MGMGMGMNHWEWKGVEAISAHIWSKLQNEAVFQRKHNIGNDLTPTHACVRVILMGDINFRCLHLHRSIVIRRDALTCSSTERHWRRK